MPVRWTLPADHSAAGLARRHVGVELSAWPNVEDIQLVASELTTNAIEHGSPPIHVALERRGGQVRLTVSSSAGATEPTLQHAAEDEDHGRGLALVGLLSDAWGWARNDGRLSVWADFRSA